MSRFREEIGEQPAVAARKPAGSGPNVASWPVPSSWRS